MTDLKIHFSELIDFTIHVFMYLEIYISLFWHYRSQQKLNEPKLVFAFA